MSISPLKGPPNDHTCLKVGVPLGILLTGTVLAGITLLVIGILGTPPIQVISMPSDLWQMCVVIGAFFVVMPPLLLIGHAAALGLFCILIVRSNHLI